MEGLINVLKDQQKVINKGLINFKKCPKDRLTLEYVDIRLELLENDWAAFRDANTKLNERFKLEDFEKKISDIYDSTEDTYITYKCLLKTMLANLQVSRETTKQVSGSSNSFVKLPKISIPIFSGKYDEWTTFHDLFVSLVHNNSSLDNVQRLHYLKTHLTGEAEQLIRHTPITDANYKQCWDLLVKRYNNKKYLATCILNRLFAQKHMQVESATALKGLLDTTIDCLNALANLEIDVSTWDIIIIHIVTFKLDSETRKQWELNNNSDSNNELPTLDQFKTFIEKRFRALECIPSKGIYQQSTKDYQTSRTKALLTTNSSYTVRCEYCSEPHKLCFCKEFAKQAPQHRRDYVAKNNMCFNCLGSNHTVFQCKKHTTCRMCNKRHHSLLHPSEEPVNKEAASIVNPTDPSTRDGEIVSCLATGKITKPEQVLLATALVKAESKYGESQIVRALLDQGSQACFITESTVQLLGLKKMPVYGLVSCLGENKSALAKHMVQLTIKSRADPDFNLIVKAYVLRKITSCLPERSINVERFHWIYSKKLHLADPKFNLPNKIDLLLGADAYSYILKEGIVKSPSGSFIAQNTSLGWVLSGAHSSENNTSHSKNTYRVNIKVMHVHVEEDDNLRKFWEIEENLGTKNMLTPEEMKCEEFYKRTTKRREDGRYVVKLPFRETPPLCTSGNSRAIAEKRLKSLERRLEGNPDLKNKYIGVINEYLSLGHMRVVPENDSKKNTAVYLPHHAVIREDKSTTKVRVVFNASEKNSNGVSLNDTLMVGPSLQADLRHTIMRWRIHSIAIVADIIKMYRQIRIAPDDAMYQRILWRDNPQDEIKDYELETVTFRTASAPYQAVRTLHQISYDDGNKYPIAAAIALNCFYMDDLMTGGSSVPEVLEIYKELTSLMKKGGFTLQKWNSNSKKVLEQINLMEELQGQTTDIRTKERDRKNKDTKLKDGTTENLVQTLEKEVQIKMDSTIKILGLTWSRKEDYFQYSVNLPPCKTTPITKRSMLSDIARLFDPLGWLAPSVILAKIFIQRLWLAGVGWDDNLDTNITKEWVTYREELNLLASVRIPRWLGTHPSSDLELHGFCVVAYSAKVAYSAVVYLRIIDANGEVKISLLAAKTRVAPIKQISIPRLELCGAVLLSKLLAEAAHVLKISNDKITAWTDSTVVLAWLNSHPSRWKTFVANRTAEILTTMNVSQWYHVSTKDNPADCASRGLLPSTLLENRLWFEGPPLLKEKTITFNKSVHLSTDLEQSVKVHMATTSEPCIFERFSSLQKLLRVIAYCRRFLKRGQDKSYLKRQEIEESLYSCIAKTQREIFTTEYKQLKDKGYIQTKSSKLKSLCVYLDDKGIIRAGGRLEKSQMNPDTKHPIVLPHSSHLTHLIIADSHIRTLHGGFQLMTNYLRSAYWILGARRLIKEYINKCVVCVKQKALTRNQFMGSLPSVRCTPARPFLNSGVDYAGPINIRTTKGRGHRSYKGYICLFVCMATRALHLEVVSDMSTQAFLAAFRRFVSRRGHCAKIWSDNGTTFIGASRELKVAGL